MASCRTATRGRHQRKGPVVEQPPEADAGGGPATKQRVSEGHQRQGPVVEQPPGADAGGGPATKQRVSEGDQRKGPVVEQSPGADAAPVGDRLPNKGSVNDTRDRGQL